MTGYDVFIIVIVLASASIGFVRGGAKEIVTLFSFLVSALVALLIFPVTGPLGRDLVDPDWMGSAAAVVVVFLVVYFGVRFLGAWISQRLHHGGALNWIDRAGGTAFGIARALLVVGVVHLIFYAATPPERVPGWLRDAKLYPVSVASARVVQLLLPPAARIVDQAAPVVKDSVRRGSAGYETGDRESMDALVEETR